MPLCCSRFYETVRSRSSSWRKLDLLFSIIFRVFLVFNHFSLNIKKGAGGERCATLLFRPDWSTWYSRQWMSLLCETGTVSFGCNIKSDVAVKFTATRTKINDPGHVLICIRRSKYSSSATLGETVHPGRALHIDWYEIQTRNISNLQTMRCLCTEFRSALVKIL